MKNFYRSACCLLSIALLLSLAMTAPLSATQRMVIGEEYTNYQ